MRYILLLLLIPSVCLAQLSEPTPTPSPTPPMTQEQEMATKLNLSVYELRASKLLNLVNQLIAVKRQEREGQIPGLGAITEPQKVTLRTQRLAARQQLKTMCKELQEIE